jgi:hypothetical protein
MFISIFAATCRSQNIIAFLDNLASTAADLSSFEVLLKLDEGADDLIALVAEYQQRSKFSLKYLVLPKLEGYYSLDVGYNALLNIAHPDTYFCWLLTDEIRLETQGWDNIAKKYIGFYPDDIIRLKPSIFRCKNYIDFFECLPCPDNYALTSRKWLEITGGFGNFWGPDSWHQCIDYYLALCKNASNPYGVWRSIPIFDIKVAGQEAGLGITGRKKLRERTYKIWQGWQKHSTHRAQENFNRLAQRLNIHIYAKDLGFDQYIIQENKKQKTITLCDIDGKRRHKPWSYRLPGLRIKFFIAYKKLNWMHLLPYSYHLRSILADELYSILYVCHLIRGKLYRFLKQTAQDIITSLHMKKLKNLPHIPFLNKFFNRAKRFKSSLALKQQAHINNYLFDGTELKIISQDSTGLTRG